MIKEFLKRKLLNNLFLSKENYDIVKCPGGYLVVNRICPGCSICIRAFIDWDKDYAYNEAKELLNYLTKNI